MKKKSMILIIAHNRVSIENKKWHNFNCDSDCTVFKTKKIKIKHKTPYYNIFKFKKSNVQHLGYIFFKYTKHYCSTFDIVKRYNEKITCVCVCCHMFIYNKKEYHDDVRNRFLLPIVCSFSCTPQHINIYA